MSRRVFLLLVLVALLLALWIEIATHHLNVTLPIKLSQVGVLASSLVQGIRSATIAIVTLLVP